MNYDKEIEQLIKIVNIQTEHLDAHAKAINQLNNNADVLQEQIQNLQEQIKELGAK